MTTTYLLEHAWVGGRVEPGVVVDVDDGVISGVTLRDRSGAPEAEPRPLEPDHVLLGLTIPGLANCHSHAFHRALRGRTQRGRGTFWTWRDQMYVVAGRLDPDSYFELARATYREMVAAGITAVGEFHYLHHQHDGAPYADPNAMGHALLEAAREAGIRITLLDSLYLSSGFGKPPHGVQVRYSDGSSQAWADRTAAIDAGPGARVGAALHSVRAVPRDALEHVARHHDGVLHVHLSEQVAENEACQAAYGVTPTRLLAAHGLLRPTTTLVHATHLTSADIALIGEANAYVDFCPTTERDLGDGVGPSRRLADAGARLTLGSDSQAVIDLFEEMRAVELDERLATMRRGHWSAAELLTAATATGHASLGWPDAGSIAVGQRADLVTLDLASPRTAGAGVDEHAVVFAASAGDVLQVVADGRLVHTRDQVGEIGRELDRVIKAVHG
ncbi:formimidoylglutamate deiminase [Nocardioides sediminis]|uniref:formimidoylglutamate deiminase n=1 Tax=Nocardioides sediminis TaxID=433648 RepID=UPI000D307867|nr:formimidoylglutamate deiminase [Nocardioides sediminis]